MKMAKTGGKQLWEKEEEFTFEQDTFRFAGTICCCTKEEKLELGPKVRVDIYLVERDSLSTNLWGKGSPFSEVIKAPCGTFSQKRLLEKRHPRDHPQDRTFGIS